MKQEHHPYIKQTYNKGADSDTDQEYLGLEANGKYRDSRNARLTSIKGDLGAAEKINGHELEHDLTQDALHPLSSAYKCIGKENVKGKNVSIWASPNFGEHTSISIDGIVMVQSKDLPWSYDFPVQTSHNDGNSGELFGTDDNVPPMIFNIQDIIDEYNSGSQKYFLEFDVKKYSVNLSSPLDIPVHTEIKPVGAGGGLPVGNYSYCLRYVNDSGDRTNLGPKTPPISIVNEYSEDSDIYPYSMTTGSNPNTEALTPYGVELKFRVNNVSNYEYIELVRYSWNNGTPEFFLPDGEIVFRQSVAPEEVSVITFLDPSDSNSNEIIPDDEEAVQLEYIEKAKGIRYYNDRLSLMNIEVGSKDYDPVFSQDSDGRYMFPCVQKMYKSGHNDSWNNTYLKSFMGGESYGFSINAYDGVGGKSFAKPIPNSNGDFDYIMPNRRDPISIGSSEEKYSYDGASVARDVDGNIGKTFEAFDHDDSIAKEDVCSIYGIADPKLSTNGNKTNTVLYTYCNTDPRINGATQTSPTTYQSQYQPIRPVNNTDNNSDGHNLRVNTKVATEFITNLNSSTQYPEYKPEAFGLNYYSKGMVVNGVDNLPDWVKSFHIGRTKRANRVICQGLGMYSLNPAGTGTIIDSLDFRSATKSLNKMWFYSPDIDSGLVSQSILDGIASGIYEVQFVSPLGFFSEVWNFAKSTNTTYLSPKDRIIDMISYARIIHDEGQINATDNPGYVGYNRWRNDLDSYNGGWFSGSDGNKVMNVSNIEVKQDGRASFFEITFEDDIYNTEGIPVGGSIPPEYGGASNRKFHSDEVKSVHEPFYIINIIQSGKRARDKDIDSYLNTSTYIKKESLIGLTVGSDVFELVDERWEDCIPSLSSGSSMASDERFVWVENEDGIRNAWMNVDFLTSSQITSIINDITTNGFYLSPIRNVYVYGVYTSNIVDAQSLASSSGDVRKEIELQFNVIGSEISGGKKVYVQYDSDAPIRVFGGDVNIGESIFSTIDRESDGNANSPYKETLFPMGLPFPYMTYEINPRIYQIAQSAPNLNIQDWNNTAGSNRCILGWIRQLCINFTCESRVAQQFAYSGDSPLEAYPRVNYIMRPHEFREDEFSSGDLDIIYDDNNIDLIYGTDYGDEYVRWKYGGFRFQNQFNIDYSAKNPIEFFSRKEFGFNEKNSFPNRVIWSLPRNVSQQDSPGLKTFTSISVFDIDDNDGEIKRAYSEDSDKGNNLYAFTDSGICLLLTKKSILSDLNAGELAYMAGDQFIGGEYWIERGIGMSDETWRTAAEGNLGFNTDSGVVRRNGIFFANKESVYRFSNNQLDDVGQNDYYARLRPELKSILNGYTTDLRGYYNHKYDEYGFLISNSLGGEIPITNTEHFVFNQLNNAWTGTRDYVFDQFVEINDELYGMRDGEIHLMDSGLLINGQPIFFDIRQVCAPELLMAKEFIRIKISSSNKPTQVNFYDFDNNLVATLDQASKGPLYLKNYNYWEQFIPRKDIGVDPDQKRIQGKVMGFGIQHNLEEDFKLVSTDVQYKILK